MRKFESFISNNQDILDKCIERFYEYDYKVWSEHKKYIGVFLDGRS